MICGDTIANSPTTSPPTMVRSAGRSRMRANMFSLIATPRIRMIPSTRREQAERGGEHEIVRRDGGLLGRDDAELGRRQLARDQIADQRRDADRRQAARRIAADDQLEAVKGAGERRAERAGNAGGGAATDQDAQVAAAQPERIADARGKAARELRVAGLETDRGADAARPHRLRRDDDAAEERHAAAMQRIGFDRIDFPLRPPAPDDFAGNAEYDAADQRHRERQVPDRASAAPTAARRAAD